jgi:hypothetical protein
VKHPIIGYTDDRGHDRRRDGSRTWESRKGEERNSEVSKGVELLSGSRFPREWVGWTSGIGDEDLEEAACVRSLRARRWNGKMIAAKPDLTLAISWVKMPLEIDPAVPGVNGSYRAPFFESNSI